MDRNTIIAIVLSVIVITVGMTVNMVFFPTDYSTVESATSVEADATAALPSTTAAPTARGQVTDTSQFKVETDAFDITLDPQGASISSIKLKTQLETDGQPVELIMKDSTGKNAFLLYLGDSSQPLEDAFSHSIDTSNPNLTTVIFSRDYEIDGTSFTVNKRFSFPNEEEYLFGVSVEFVSNDGTALPFDHYTLGYDPQVGPYFEELSNNYGEYRRAHYLEADRSSKRNVSFSNGVGSISNQLEWAAVAGKYFTVIGIPYSAGASTVTEFTQYTDSAISQGNSFFFNRNSVSGSSVNDIYYFYTGPKLTSALRAYDITADNAFGLSELQLDEVLDSSSWLGWLQTILRYVLNFFESLTHNYGIAIILLTILVKIIIQPISKKGMDSNAKMAALSPKMQELQTKYKDDPNAMNAAMAKLYKEEGINPMGSCLPMLIQFPIFIALYGLLNTHYELRGSMFIPGWIPDLSVPDNVFTLPFSIPMLGSGVHILPIIYTASMIFSMKITQATNTQSSGQAGMMKFMTYGMPIIFFFVLYNAPSGLLLYWTVMNFISILQQLYVNSKKTKKYADEIQAREDAKVNKYKPTKKRK